MSGRGKKPAAPRKKANGYKMPAPIAGGEVITDTLMKKKWIIGPSIGVGGFGEIYSACDHESKGISTANYPFVIKIEPHENGPLFVEKHFYVRNANKDDIAKYMKSKNLSSLGMPTYFGSGSHDYKGEKYRYLVLERYGKDLWTIFKENGRCFPPTTVFQLGLQMLEVLEYIHSRGYVHADIKGANILLGKKKGTENQAYLVDFGLATRVTEKEFKPDPKCAHNGTIEYTSRDAHLGVSTMRGDLEILGYNLLQWIVGELPWEKTLTQPKTVQEMKENFMKNVRANITKQYKNVPESLIKFFEYINSLKPKDAPDYDKCRALFENYLKKEGKTRNSKLEFSLSKNATSKTKASPVKTKKKDLAEHNDSSDDTKQNGDVPKPRRGRKVLDSSIDSADTSSNATPEITKKVVKRKGRVKKAASVKSIDDSENVTPDSSVNIIRKSKRRSTEPALVVKVKKAKLTPKATPPVKRNHANIATQTSVEKLKRNPRQVSFDSPMAEIGEPKPSKLSKESSANSSGDIFEDSFVEEVKKVKPKKRLLSDEEVVVKRVVKKKITNVKKVKAGRSWKDLPTVVNGRSPPK